MHIYDLKIFSTNIYYGYMKFTDTQFILSTVSKISKNLNNNIFLKNQSNDAN